MGGVNNECMSKLIILLTDSARLSVYRISGLSHPVCGFIYRLIVTSSVHLKNSAVHLHSDTHHVADFGTMISNKLHTLCEHDAVF